MSLRTFAPSSDERVIAGVCAGIARTLGVDATLVRLIFALLALAGGAGILLYLALWAWAERQQIWVAALLAFVAGCALLWALGFSDRSVIGIALIAGGLALAWRQGGSFHPDAPLSYGGIVLAALGAVLLLWGGGTSSTLLAPGAVAGALLLIAGPWVWRLALERDVERTARIRSEERSDMAARVHDSVLQTLALIQRHADEPRRVSSLARRQERELRGWLYGNKPLGDETASMVAALSAAAGDIEELHGVRVELASAGDCPVDASVSALVLAAREAMTNAAKFAGVDEIDVYAEVGDGAVSVFVRDRGAGFDRAAVPADRRGLVESIEGRMERAGGSAAIVTSLGGGTDVELHLPRRAT
jgi:signal transduction histidine kinase